jgi:hypothetical protein
MFDRWSWLAAALVAVSSATTAAEPGVVPVPSAVRALEGCWYGSGHVMGKPVTIVLSAKPIVQGALFVIDAASVAKDDASDRYSAHLILGGANQPSGARAEPISGFWADSFGGTFTATGQSRVSNCAGQPIVSLAVACRRAVSPTVCCAPRTWLGVRGGSLLPALRPLSGSVLARVEGRPTFTGQAHALPSWSVASRSGKRYRSLNLACSVQSATNTSLMAGSVIASAAS